MTGTKLNQVEGYVVCDRCSRGVVVDVVAARTGGLCAACWVDLRGQPALRFRHAGTTFEMKRSGLPKSKPRKLTPGRRERIKTRDRARLNALRELAYRHPVEFADILASERGRLGLEPWTIDAALAAQLVDAGVNHGR